jgi:unsaturated rhamnogalacturonyl hydrolase
MQNKMPLFVQCARTIVSTFIPEKLPWHYETGLLLQALLEVDAIAGIEDGYIFSKRVMEHLIDPAGNIQGYEISEYNSDQVNAGKVLFDLYNKTQDNRYRLALQTLRKQFDTHPRTKAGGFWHKKIYPHQIWLDGLYMRCPFLARYGKEFHEPALYDLVTFEFELVEGKCRDARVGLLYHGWDESKTQLWSNSKTGCSPHFWARGMGWFMMGLVDVLDFLPETHRGWKSLQDILNRTAETILIFQDQETGLWYQIIDQKEREGNYRESSASAMFIYALAKGIRKGYLPMQILPTLERAYNGFVQEKITIDGEGKVHIHDICKVAGLGGHPYRDGSYEYYIGEPRVTDDPKGVGAFLLASVEVEGKLLCMAHT